MHPACHPNLVQSQLHAHVLQRMNGLPRLPPSLSRLPPQCAKVRVSQPRLYGCLLHPHSPHRLERRLQAAPAARERRGTTPCHPPSQPTPLGTPTSVGTRGARAPRNCTMPPTLAAHTAWNADFSRHPRRESAAELHHATHPRSPHGLERRLQSAPAARERRGTAPCHPPSQPTPLGTPTSVGTRGARAPRN